MVKFSKPCMFFTYKIASEFTFLKSHKNFKKLWHTHIHEFKFLHDVKFRFTNPVFYNLKPYEILFIKTLFAGNCGVPKVSAQAQSPCHIFWKKYFLKNDFTVPFELVNS